MNRTHSHCTESLQSFRNQQQVVLCNPAKQAGTCFCLLRSHAVHTSLGNVGCWHLSLLGHCRTLLLQVFATNPSNLYRYVSLSRVSGRSLVFPTMYMHVICIYIYMIWISPQDPGHPCSWSWVSHPPIIISGAPKPWASVAALCIALGQFHLEKRPHQSKPSLADTFFSWIQTMGNIWRIGNWKIYGELW